MVAALPGSIGERYLNARGFRLDQLQGLVGYSAPGRWPNKGRDWKLGRVVFPHTRPDAGGSIVSLYGRAVEFPGQEAPKHLKHDHLSGTKGWWIPRPLSGADTVYLTEGAFDAAAVHVAKPDALVVAIFGLSGLRWDLLPSRSKVVFALDNDMAGATAFRELALAGLLLGREVLRLGPDAYKGEKDL